MKIKKVLWESLAQGDRHIGYSKKAAGAKNAILNYHSISPGETNLFGNLSPDQLHQDLEFLTTYFEIVDLPSILLNPTRDNKRIALTFDDGYENFHVNAVPVLEAFDAPATVFVNPSFIGDRNRDRIMNAHNLTDGPSPIHMNYSQLQDLVDSKIITIGNHTSTHPNLSNINDSKVLRQEIIGAQETLENEFGITVDRFSYPYGSCSKEAIEMVAHSHDYAAGPGQGLLSQDVDPHQIPRIGAHKSEHVVHWELTDLSQRIRNIYNRYSL